MLTDKFILNFIKKVHFFEPDKCWEWSASKNSGGYGTCGIVLNEKKFYLAHRLSFYLANGHLTEGLDVCHKCDNPSCINPDHLFEGTVSDNLNDMVSKNRHHGATITHCPRGHEYTEENSRYYRGSRSCKKCDYSRPSRGKKKKS